jgi:hypothetical protein
VAAPPLPPRFYLIWLPKALALLSPPGPASASPWHPSAGHIRRIVCQQRSGAIFQLLAQLAESRAMTGARAAYDRLA